MKTTVSRMLRAIQNHRSLSLLLCETFRSTRTIAHFTGELTARGVDIVAAGLAHRCHVTELVEPATEGEHLPPVRLFKV